MIVRSAISIMRTDNADGDGDGDGDGSVEHK